MRNNDIFYSADCYGVLHIKIVVFNVPRSISMLNYRIVLLMQAIVLEIPPNVIVYEGKGNR